MDKYLFVGGLESVVNIGSELVELQTDFVGDEMLKVFDDEGLVFEGTADVIDRLILRFFNLKLILHSKLLL